MKPNPWQERLVLECTDEAYERFLAALGPSTDGLNALTRAIDDARVQIAELEKTPTTAVNASRNQPYDVLITRPSCWGNSFHIGIDGTRQQIIEEYEAHVRADPAFVAKIKVELKGKRLGCYCKPKACHGGVLAHIADEEG